MTDYPLSPEDNTARPLASVPKADAVTGAESASTVAAHPPAYASTAATQRVPFSQMAIWGFVISCVGLVVFSFIGIMGVIISSRGFRAARTGTVRGRGLAIAGMIIGTADFLYYAISFIVARIGH